MNLLLDTHALLWWLDDPAKLAPSARAAIGDPANLVHISAVVIWEIVVKRGLGKLEVNGDFDAALAANPFRYLDITIAHARAVADLPPIHRDPFDRMLVAQAIVEGFRLVTRDPLIAQYPVSEGFRTPRSPKGHTSTSVRKLMSRRGLTGEGSDARTRPK